MRKLLSFSDNVKSGERVLIHAGASGVGTAATQLVRLAGAIPYVTAGSTEKIQLAKSMGAQEGFNYKEGDFTQALMKATDGKDISMIAIIVNFSVCLLLTLFVINVMSHIAMVTSCCIASVTQMRNKLHSANCVMAVV